MGIEINMDQELKLVRIIAPIADTPAYRAGLKAGDLITHVDGDRFEAWGSEALCAGFGQNWEPMCNYQYSGRVMAPLT